MTIGLSSSGYSSECTGGKRKKRQGGTGRSRKGETSQRVCAMDGMEMVVK